MADNMKDIVKIALDAHKGAVEKYSVDQSQEVIREALIELNNGSTKLDLRAIRDGKCVGLFALVEEVLKKTIPDDLQSNPFFANLVDFRNMAEGDENIFVTEDNDLFTVSKAADGTQGIRRQRLGGRSEVAIPTELRIIKIYEELNRVLAGRVDFNDLVNRVSQSVAHNVLEEVSAIWTNVTSSQLGGNAFIPAAGSFNENTLLTLIANVEAASEGKQAMIIGTKIGLHNIAQSVVSDGGKDDLYNMGYFGKFYGTPTVCLNQKYKFGTKTFMHSDKEFTIIAGDVKPIKVVYEGSPIVLMGDPMANKDMTHEYMYSDKWGTGIVMANGNAGIGKYILS